MAIVPFILTAGRDTLSFRGLN